MMTYKADIFIVGGGIAGPALAAALRMSGLRIVLVERSDEPLDTARGDHLQPRTAEILDAWGLLADFIEAGARKRLGSRWVSAAGDTLLHARVDDLPVPHPYYLYLNHEVISERLLASAQQNPAFTLLQPSSLKNIVAHGEGLPSTLLVSSEGEDVQVEAAMIVGADGRASAVSRLFDFSTDIYAYDNPLVVMFAPCGDDDPRHDLRAYLTKAGVVSFVPRQPHHWKIGFPIPKGELTRWKNSSASERSAWLGDLVPEMAQLDTEVVGFYQPVKLSARQWVKGNVVLIGDACHALHPGQSQGMNITIRCIHQMIAQLPAQEAFTVSSVSQALKTYDDQIRPIIEPMLNANHERGREMDSIDGDKTLARSSFYQGIQNETDQYHAYCMRMAGYPAPKP